MSPDQKMITVRLSAELHRRLRKLAYRREVPMNTLCVNVLLRAVDEAEESDAVQAEENRG